MTNQKRNMTTCGPSSTQIDRDTRGSESSSSSDGDGLPSVPSSSIFGAHIITGNPPFARVARADHCIPPRNVNPVENDLEILSDSSVVDLCDSDDSEVEIIRYDDGPDSPIVLRSRPTESTVNDQHYSRNFMFGIPLIDGRTEPRFLSGFDFMEHIQERIRTQAILLERLRVFSIDIRPQVPPSTIIDSLPIRRVKDMAEAAALGACPICLEPYRPRMTVRVLPSCGHSVHKPCMDKWISKGLKYTCPLDNRAIEVSNASAADMPQSTSSLHSETRQPLRRSSRMSQRLSGRGERPS